MHIVFYSFLFFSSPIWQIVNRIYFSCRQHINKPKSQKFAKSTYFCLCYLHRTLRMIASVSGWKILFI